MIIKVSRVKELYLTLSLEQEGATKNPTTTNNKKNCVAIPQTVLLDKSNQSTLFKNLGGCLSDTHGRRTDKGQALVSYKILGHCRP